MGISTIALSYPNISLIYPMQEAPGCCGQTARGLPRALPMRANPYARKSRPPEGGFSRKPVRFRPYPGKHARRPPEAAAPKEQTLPLFAAGDSAPRGIPASPRVQEPRYEQGYSDHPPCAAGAHKSDYADAATNAQAKQPTPFPDIQSNAK